MQTGIKRGCLTVISHHNLKSKRQTTNPQKDESFSILHRQLCFFRFFLHWREHEKLWTISKLQAWLIPGSYSKGGGSKGKWRRVYIHFMILTFREPTSRTWWISYDLEESILLGSDHSSNNNHLLLCVTVINFFYLIKRLSCFFSFFWCFSSGMN